MIILEQYLYNSYYSSSRSSSLKYPENSSTVDKEGGGSDLGVAVSVVCRTGVPGTRTATAREEWNADHGDPEGAATLSPLPLAPDMLVSYPDHQTGNEDTLYTHR